MKQLLYFAALLLAFFVSCTKEQEQSVPEVLLHHFCINTTMPGLEADSPVTKAEMKASVRLQWSDGDQISVVNLSTGKTMLGSLTAKVVGDKVRFEGDLSGAIKTGDKMAAIYPCQDYTGIVNIPDFSLDLSDQSCTTKDDLSFVAYSLFDCKTTGIVDVSSDFKVPLSFNQIALATIDPETQIDYVELTNVGNGINFHANKEEGTLELTPSVGRVRISPESKLSGKNGALFAYCALAASPASGRTITVKALPKIYVASWATSAMTTSKFYTSIASNFDAQEYKDFMVSAPSSTEVGYQGGIVVFSVTSNNISWTASSTPALDISPASGNGCENLEVTVTVPRNNESAERSFLVSLSGGSDEYNYIITQKADPNKETLVIPDINLKKYLVSVFDEDGDGEISVVEAEDIINVNCSDKNIADLSGLERCPNLKYLNCKGNYVSEIVLPNLIKLESIVAYDNPIERINVNNDTSLSALYLQNVSTNAIESDSEIRIAQYTQASTLSLAFAGTKYTALYLYNSTVLTSFDVSENTQLTDLKVYGNSLIESIDVSSLTALTTLSVHSCALEILDVTNNVNLVSLLCYGNNLSSLDIDNNNKLTILNAKNNNLTSIRLSNNTALIDINVGNNKLINVNVRKCSHLKSLSVNDNTGITVLTLDNNPRLESLNASNTGISDIDLSANTSLTELNLSGCSNIHSINLLEFTNLSSLNVSQNKSLETLEYNGCSIIATGLKVGVYVNVAGDKGILFYYFSTQPKIVSMKEEGKVSFRDVEHRIHYPDSHWYVPTKHDLLYIYKNKSIINNALSNHSGELLHNSWYWSSDVYKYGNTHSLYVVNLENGQDGISSNDYASGLSDSPSDYLRVIRDL